MLYILYVCTISFTNCVSVMYIGDGYTTGESLSGGKLRDRALSISAQSNVPPYSFRRCAFRKR
jgi:hypothetical protein